MHTTSTATNRFPVIGRTAARHERTPVRDGRRPRCRRQGTGCGGRPGSLHEIYPTQLMAFTIGGSGRLQLGIELGKHQPRADGWRAATSTGSEFLSGTAGQFRHVHDSRSRRKLRGPGRGQALAGSVDPSLRRSRADLFATKKVEEDGSFMERRWKYCVHDYDLNSRQRTGTCDAKPAANMDATADAPGPVRQRRSSWRGRPGNHYYPASPDTAWVFTSRVRGTPRHYGIVRDGLTTSAPDVVTIPRGSPSRWRAPRADKTSNRGAVETRQRGSGAGAVCSRSPRGGPTAAGEQRVSDGGQQAAALVSHRAVGDGSRRIRVIPVWLPNQTEPGARTGNHVPRGQVRSASSRPARTGRLTRLAVGDHADAGRLPETIAGRFHAREDRLAHSSASVVANHGSARPADQELFGSENQPATATVSSSIHS